MLSGDSSNKEQANNNDAEHSEDTPKIRRYSLFESSSSSGAGHSISAVSLIKKKLTSVNSNNSGRSEANFYSNMMNHKNKLTKNLIRRQATVSGGGDNGDGMQSPGGSKVCQRCQRFEVDLTNTSDNLSATDAELKASRQVISLLQRQLELFQVEKEGLEKLIVSQRANNYDPHDKLNESYNEIKESSIQPADTGDNSPSSQGTIDGTSTIAGEPPPADEIQKKLLTLIKTQLYAKDEEIIKLKSGLKETQNEKEQMSLHIHDLEDDISKLKAEVSLLRENLALRDQTIVSLSNEVFEQSGPTDVANNQRRQSSAETVLSPIRNSSNRLHQTQILKLNDTLEAYKKTNELLSHNVVKLTERCSRLERREMEAKSQAQELEARCCQIQSKLLSLLKEIEQSSKQATSGSCDTEGSSGPSDDFIQSEPVKLLIKRLLEDKSLDIPLSWKEGNRSRVKVKSDELEDSSKRECDELGFYIQSNDKSKKSASLGEQQKAGARSMSETWGIRLSELVIVEEAHVADESIDDEYFRHKCVDSSKNEQAKWRRFWDDFIKDFDKMNLSKSKEFKGLLRSGVPQEYRCKIWKALIDLKIGNDRRGYGSDYYQSLLEPNQSSASSSKNSSKLPGQHLNPSSKQIELDLLRTLPDNKYFETLDSPGTVRLRRVLNAFAAHKPHIGYCQGMNRLAAVALLVLPEEEAFWCLVSIVDKIMPVGYYNDLWLAQVDSNVVMDFVAVMMPDLYEHFIANSIELSLCWVSWFLTIFVDGTPPAFFLRLWDCFLYEGDKIMFRVALALLKVHEDALLKLNSSASVNNYLRSSLGALIDYDRLFSVAFESINPLPSRALRLKREANFDSMRARIKKSSGKVSSQNSPDMTDGRYQTDRRHDDSPTEDSSVISV